MKEYRVSDLEEAAKESGSSIDSLLDTDTQSETPDLWNPEEDRTAQALEQLADKFKGLWTLARSMGHKYESLQEGHFILYQSSRHRWAQAFSWTLPYTSPMPMQLCMLQGSFVGDLLLGALMF